MSNLYKVTAAVIALGFSSIANASRTPEQPANFKNQAILPKVIRTDNLPCINNYGAKDDYLRRLAWVERTRKKLAEIER